MTYGRDKPSVHPAENDIAPQQRRSIIERHISAKTEKGTPMATPTEMISKKGSVLYVEADTEVGATANWRVRLFCKHTKVHLKRESMEADYQLVPPYMIHPLSVFAQIWLSVMAFFIVVCFFFVPYQLAFNYKEDFQGMADQMVWATLVRIMDTVFLFDVFVQFNIVYFDDGEIVTDRRLVAKRYLRSWFLPDLLSSTSSILVSIGST
jgi:hypothetical protein